MRLSAREQQVLGTIEAGLADSDPKLASLLGMFSRLTSGEEMPTCKKGRARRLRAPKRTPRNSVLHLTLLGRHARPNKRYLGLRPALHVTWWCLLSAALVALALILSHGGGGRGGCVHSWELACVGFPPADVHRPLCTSAGEWHGSCSRKPQQRSTGFRMRGPRGWGHR